MNPFTIIIPHYRTGQMTAFTIHQILKHSHGRNIKIIIVDNSNGEGLEYLKPFSNDIVILSYPPDKMQSHGIAYDFAMSIVRTEYFITLESDSYPTQDGWLDYYDKLIAEGYDSAGSLLHQSGGVYQHPAGALYRKSIWLEAKTYTDKIEYTYFPNMAMKEGFPCHLMVHAGILFNFLHNPGMYVELHHSYVGLTMDELIKRRDDYLPICGVFHNGMGNSQESFNTYRHRNIVSEPPNALLLNDTDLILRMGLEPGQWFCYWQIAMGKNIKYIPTQVHWLPGRIHQQQEYTLMENGVRHEWAVTAYHKCDAPALQDIIDFKANRMEELYNSLPREVRV